ncbi:DUF3822 family protein, partial [Bacteroidales bacterium OttesenSCG-928-L03]|nr:DUF3822 family protein [Bacteroidales bacterium OttesenSCG-928-L03]
FGFSLYDPVQDGSYFYLPIARSKDGSALSDFQDIYYDNDFLTLPFRKTYLLNCSPSFTYVPTHLFEEKQAGDYMDFLFSSPSGKIMHHHLMMQQITIVHGMDEDLYSFLHRSFFDLRFYHHTAPLMTYFFNQVQLVNAKRMIINLESKGIDVICFERDYLLLGNHFPTASLEEAVYYILFIWKQLGFDQLKDYIYIAGNMEGRKDLMSNIKDYIRNMIPVNITPKAHFERVDVLNIPFHLAALSLCEL